EIGNLRTSDKQRAGRRTHILHRRIKPQVVAIGIKDDWHTVVAFGVVVRIEQVSKLANVLRCPCACSPAVAGSRTWTSELLGDYTPETMLIRVWMKTAVRKEITSFGTFLSTLCHEFCHHLDFQQFRFPDSWHTRGFYERAAALYHQVWP